MPQRRVPAPQPDPPVLPTNRTRLMNRPRSVPATNSLITSELLEVDGVPLGGSVQLYSPYTAREARYIPAVASEIYNTTSFPSATPATGLQTPQTVSFSSYAHATYSTFTFSAFVSSPTTTTTLAFEFGFSALDSHVRKNPYFGESRTTVTTTVTPGGSGNITLSATTLFDVSATRMGADATALADIGSRLPMMFRPGDAAGLFSVRTPNGGSPGAYINGFIGGLQSFRCSTVDYFTPGALPEGL